MATIYPEIAERINFACDKSGVAPHGQGRQAYLADKLGCTQEATRKWLRGYTRPSKRFIIPLAELLNCDVAWLEYGKEPEAVNKGKRVEMDERISAAILYVFSCLRMIDIAAVMADETDPEDLIVFHKGRQHFLSVILAEKVEKGYLAQVSNYLSDRTKMIVVVPSEEYGRVSQIPLTRSTLNDLGKSEGGYTKVYFERKGRAFMFDGKSVMPKFSLNEVFG